VTAVCPHRPGDYVERFTGRGTEAELVCEDCAANRLPAFPASDEAVQYARDSIRVRFDGDPELVELPSELAFAHETIELDVPDLVDLRALGADDRSRWLGVTDTGALLELDLDRRSVRALARVAIPAPVELHVSPSGAFAAVVEARGVRGEIVELATDRRIPLERDGYHSDAGRFPFAFVTHRDREVAIYAPEWNRLAAFDLRTGEALTARATPPAGDQHYLDYFHAGLQVSPGGTMIADSGWAWAPFGVVATWSLERWLDDHPWESEDGRSRRDFSWRESWDLPLCWIDDARLIIGGHGDIGATYDAAVDIYDARSGKLERWFAGPEAGAELVFDRVLFALGRELEVYDVERGGRLARDPHVTARYHPSAKCFATLPRERRITISRLRGLDAHAPWATETVRALAASITDHERELPVLGDALDDAGCTDAEMLAHCRKPGPHGASCWVLDRLARR